jgi:hypothetical protein
MCGIIYNFSDEEEKEVGWMRAFLEIRNKTNTNSGVFFCVFSVKKEEEMCLTFILISHQFILLYF